MENGGVSGKMAVSPGKWLAYCVLLLVAFYMLGLYLVRLHSFKQSSKLALQIPAVF